jgi:hypothetical protein
MTIPRNKSLVAILAVVGLLLMGPPRAGAFPRETRNQILKDAMAFCPGYLKDYLKRHEQEILDASQTIDRMRSFEMERYDIVKSGRLVVDALVSDLKGGHAEKSATARRFGLLAILVAEAHYIGRKKIVSSTGTHLPPEVVYTGFKRIDDPPETLRSLVTKYKPFRNDERVRVFDYLYVQAVSKVANFWQTVWVLGGFQPGRDSPVKAISHK